MEKSLFEHPDRVEKPGIFFSNIVRAIIKLKSLLPHQGTDRFSITELQERQAKETGFISTDGMPPFFATQNDLARTPIDTIAKNLIDHGYKPRDAYKAARNIHHKS